MYQAGSPRGLDTLLRLEMDVELERSQNVRGSGTGAIVLYAALQKVQRRDKMISISMELWVFTRANPARATSMVSQ